VVFLFEFWPLARLIAQELCFGTRTSADNFIAMASDILTYLLTYILTYLLHGAQSFWEADRFAASQEIPRIYGTRRFITAFTSARQLSLSWATSIQSIIHIPLPEDPS
jgi:hypothetical protein